jgi:hypothetical protein
MKECDLSESLKVKKAPSTPCIASSFEESKDDAMVGNDAKVESKDDDAMVGFDDKV